MGNFGKCGGGGRRSAQRKPASLIALVTTLQESQSAVVMDVSSTGVRLRGDHLPQKGGDCFVNIDGVVAFGTVVRCNADERGIAFDAPLEPSDEKALRHRVALAAGLPPEVRAAYDDWMMGIAR